MNAEEKKVVNEVIKLLRSLSASQWALGPLRSWVEEDVGDEEVFEMLEALNNGTLGDRIKIIAERTPLPPDSLN